MIKNVCDMYVCIPEAKDDILPDGRDGLVVQPRARDQRHAHPQHLVEHSSELKTLNNFCLSRFSQVFPDLYFLQNANLYRKRV